MFKVFVSRSIPRVGLDILQNAEEISEVLINPLDRVLKADELARAVKGCDGVLCLLTDQINERIINAADRTLVFSNYAVGYNNIDVELATKKGIVVTNTPGVLTETTADLAFALLLSIARRIPEADSYTRQGKFDNWSPKLMLGTDVAGKTLGIIGGGRIGLAMAKRALGFSMEIKYLSRSIKPQFEHLGASLCSLDELLAQSDFVSLHTDLNPSTYHLLGEAEFKRMKKSAYLINTARGPIINEEALAHALEDGELMGAALDVFEFEPHIHDKLMTLKNVILCPHIGSATKETRNKMAHIAAHNLLSVLRGESPKHLVNSDVIVREFTYK